MSDMQSTLRTEHKRPRFSLFLGNSHERWLFLAVWIVYLVHVVPGGGVNPNRYFDLTYSLVNQGVVNIDAYHENTIDKAFKDGHYYSGGLPGPSIVAIPSYLVFRSVYSYLIPQTIVAELAKIQSFKAGSDEGFYKQDTTAFFLSTIWITWFTLSVFSAFAAVILFKLMLRLNISRGYAFASTLLYAWGTPAFFYSTTYFSHVFHASLIILLLYVISGAQSLGLVPGSKWFVGLGLLSGSTILFEYQGSLVIFCVGLYVLYKWGWNSALFFGFGVCAPLFLLLTYNFIAFGGPFRVPFQYYVGSNREVVHGVGFLGFTLPTWQRLIGLTFSWQRGIFVYSPLLLLAPFGWFWEYNDRPRQRGLVLLSIGLTFATFLWTASYQAWDGHAAFGPRLLTIIFPVLILGVAFATHHIHRFIWIILALFSFLTNWFGAQFGMATTVFEPWHKFFTQGFTLPVIDAVMGHSTGNNLILALVVQNKWLIIVGYMIMACLIAALCRTIARDTQAHLSPAHPKRQGES